MRHSGEFGIFHLGTCSTERAISLTRTVEWHCGVGIAVIDAPLGAFYCRSDAQRIHRAADRHSCSKQFGISYHHIVGRHCAHRQTYHIHTTRVDALLGNIFLYESMHAADECRRTLLNRHFLRNKRHRSVDICPIFATRALREQHITGIFLTIDGIEKLLRTVKKLSLIVLATLTGTMQNRLQELPAVARRAVLKQGQERSR